LRLREIEAVIQHRGWNVLPETDDTDLFAEAVAASVTGQNLHDWCARWAPFLDGAVIDEIAARHANRSVMSTPDGCAKMLNVTMAERSVLGLRTIGACDVTEEQRKQFSRELKQARDAARQRQKRREAGSVDRVSYEVNSISKTKPWEAVGMGRSQWYAAGKPTPEKMGRTSPSRVPPFIGLATDLSGKRKENPEATPPMPMVANDDQKAAGPRGARGTRFPRFLNRNRTRPMLRDQGELFSAEVIPFPLWRRDPIVRQVAAELLAEPDLAAKERIWFDRCQQFHAALADFDLDEGERYAALCKLADAVRAEMYRLMDKQGPSAA
jgi:hypothetical protein